MLLFEKASPTQKPDGYGKLQMGLEWLQKNLSCSNPRDLRELVNHDHPELSVSRQCVLLGLPRSTLNYRPVAVRQSTLGIMARFDTLYLKDPCTGSRRMVAYLAREGIPISRDRVRNLRRRMGIRAIYQKPRTMDPNDPSERFPCLVDLREVTVEDQVWATDITYTLCRRDSSTSWRSWISTPGMSTPLEKPSATAGSSPTALTQSSDLTP